MQTPRDIRFSEDNIRNCLDFTINRYFVLFCLFEILFGIFTLFTLANRPLFAATQECKSAQKSSQLNLK